MITPAEFKAAFPKFAEESDEDIQRFITASVPEFNETRWGGFYSVGVGNWVAHEIVLEKALGNTPATAGASMDATEKTVGRVSVKYSDAILDLKAKDPFMRTVYGQKYKHYLRLAGTGAALAV